MHIHQAATADLPPPAEPRLVPIPAIGLETARIAARDAWLDGSAFVKDGEPVVLFHGTDHQDFFNIFAHCDEASLGFHFGSQGAANYRIDDIFRMGEDNEGLIIPVICRAKNPLRLKDHFMWSFRSVASELEDLGIATPEEAENLCDAYEEESFFALLERAGYDCVVYRNECEHKEGQADSLLVWRAELLKSPFASVFDPEDPRLLPQNETSEEDLERWFARRQAIEERLAELAAPAPAFG